MCKGEKTTGTQQAVSKIPGGPVIWGMLRYPSRVKVLPFHAPHPSPTLPPRLLLCFFFFNTCCFLTYHGLCSCASVVFDPVASLITAPWIIAHQTPLSMGILQARILEWVATPSSKEGIFLTQGSKLSCLCLLTTGRFFSTKPPGKPNIWLG